MTARQKLYDQQGRPLDVGARLASGGEGAVYPLARDLSRLAKVYHQPPDAAKVAE